MIFKKYIINTIYILSINKVGFNSFSREVLLFSLYLYIIESKEREIENISLKFL